jgi:hypothetical protein
MVGWLAQSRSLFFRGSAPLEVSVVRQRLLGAISAARTRAQERRTRVADAERAFDTLLTEVAAPLARQLVGALKAENIPFTVSTPERGLRLASEHGREDVLELGLDTAQDPPQVVLRVRRARGSRTLDEERQVKPGAAVESVGEQDLLEAFLAALAPWFER